MSNSKFAILIIFVLFLASAIFTSYYFLIARPKIKADCLNAATRVVDERSWGTNEAVQRINFDDAQYKECIKIF